MVHSECDWHSPTYTLAVTHTSTCPPPRQHPESNNSPSVIGGSDKMMCYGNVLPLWTGAGPSVGQEGHRKKKKHRVCKLRCDWDWNQSRAERWCACHMASHVCGILTVLWPFIFSDRRARTRAHTYIWRCETAAQTEQEGFKWCLVHKLRLFLPDEVLFNAPLLCSNRPTCSAGTDGNRREAHKESLQGASGATYGQGAGFRWNNRTDTCGSRSCVVNLLFVFVENNTWWTKTIQNKKWHTIVTNILTH